VEQLIKTKCQQTAAVGAVSTGAGIIPGIGTAASLTVGVAVDIGTTFKLQAELVIEIAEAHQYKLNEQEKHNIILVVTGISAGGNQMLSRAGKKASVKISERYAWRWLTHALPIIGVAASAGTNALSTYIIGQRAHAYFSRDTTAPGNWIDSLRTISGVDERKLGTWLVDTGQRSWDAASSGTQHTAGAISGFGSAAAAQAANATVATRDGIVNTANSVGARIADTGDALGETAAGVRSAVADTVGRTADSISKGVSSTVQRAQSLVPRKGKDEAEEADEA
jgi:hypothetical protein